MLLTRLKNSDFDVAVIADALKRPDASHSRKVWGASVLGEHDSPAKEED